MAYGKTVFETSIYHNLEFKAAMHQSNQYFCINYELHYYLYVKGVIRIDKPTEKYHSTYLLRAL